MRKLAAVILTLSWALFVSATSFAQPAGQLQSGQIWGNPTANQAYATGTTIGAILDRYYCTAQGSILYRGATLWACLAPGTAGLPLVTGGAGANVSYSTLANAALQNSSFTLGSTSVSLGGTVTTFAGMTFTTPTINGGALSGTFSGTPAFSGANFITLGNIVQDSTAWSLLGNAAGSTANYAPFTIASLTSKASPASSDLVMIYDVSGTALKQTTVSALASAGSVGSVNGLTGALTIATGGGATVTSSGTTITLQSPGGLLNKFRNGTFDVAQRGTQTISTSPNYGLDGWLVSFTGTGGISVSQGTAYGRGTRYAMYMAGVAGNTDIATGQHIESLVAAPMAGQTVTVQVGFYQTTGAPVALKVSTCYAGAADNFSTCTIDLAVTSMQSCASSTYCVESYTFNVNANAINGYNVTFDCGAIVASQYCVLQNADIRVTPGVATGLNSNPPPPELRNVAEETVFCQRYLNTSYPQGYAPGAATTLGIAQVGFEINNSLISAANVRFPTTMRAAPTLTFWDGAGNSGKISYTASSSSTFTNNQTNTCAGVFNTSANSFDYIACIASTTAIYWAHYVASAEL